MTIKKLIINTALVGSLLAAGSCTDYLDINKSPNSISDAPIEQLLTSVTASVGFMGGSDLYRYGALISQQVSGQGTGATTQPQEYERYNIAGSDVNNLWNTLYSTILSDAELIIIKANETKSPHYAGVAKITKAYVYQLIVDTWGNAPFTEALKFTSNTKPKFDDGAAIYTATLALLDEGIADIKQATSTKSPGTNSTIFSGTFTGASGTRLRWERFANTLKLRMLLHYSKIDRPKAVSQITALVGSGAIFMTANADNFEMNFLNAPRAQNSIHQFELDRGDQQFPNNTLVTLMNNKVDPRRARFLTSFPFTYNTTTSAYKGAKGGDAPSTAYSRMHIYLRGDTTKTAAPINTNGSLSSTSFTYTGAAPIRMLTFAEYNFIRAEAALYGATGDAQTFYQAGIRASMTAAGIATTAIDAYITANGTLTGTESEKLKQIIEEKFVANFGVVLEPWTDIRRTGFPVITPPTNAAIPSIPRSLFYPQTEVDLNKDNLPNKAQKADMLERVFWDK